MAWIDTIGFDDAAGRLRTLYDAIAGGRRRVDNILSVHSLRPHTLAGHLALYKSVLHHTRNELPVWFLEAIGVLVSLINQCSYCVDHHAAGLRREVASDEDARRIVEALRNRRFDEIFDARESAALLYVVALSADPSSVSVEQVEAMREAGLSDGEILEVNQVAAYFAYANRTVSGLGVTIDGDELGLSPPDSDDLEDWEHR